MPKQPLSATEKSLLLGKKLSDTSVREQDLAFQLAAARTRIEELETENQVLRDSSQVLEEKLKALTHNNTSAKGTP